MQPLRVVPPEVVQVDLRWVRDWSPADTIRSDGSRRSRPRSSDSSVMEEDTIYFQLRQDAGGAWRVPLHLSDFQEKTWDNVSTGMAEQALLQLYPSLFRRSTRVALAANGHCLRGSDLLGPYVDLDSMLAIISHGDGPPARVDPGEGPAVRRAPEQAVREEGNRLHGLPDIRETFTALKAEAEARPDQAASHEDRSALCASGADWAIRSSRLMLLPAKATQATGGMLERMVKDQLPEVSRAHRVCMVRADSSIVQQQEIVQFDREEILWAVIIQPQGAMVPEAEETLQGDSQADHERTPGTS